MAARLGAVAAVAASLALGGAERGSARVLEPRLAGATTLRLHLAGFGTPLPARIDAGPCPQGRTLVPLLSSAGARVGAATGCVLSISQARSPGGSIERIDATARETYRLPGGTVVTLETQTIRFARDQRHTVATFHGRVVDGSGRFAHARGSVAGGGRGVDGRADWRLRIRLR